VKRADREIVDREQIDRVIRDSQVCRLAMAKDNEPYLVPISFGYDGESLYLHTARTGKKIEFFEAGSRICFEFEGAMELVTDDKLACKWTMAFESVIGYGQIEELTGEIDKVAGLNQIMQQYSGRTWIFEPASLAAVRVWRINISSMTGKQSPGKSG
jgi:uncharacterized protein